MKLLLVIYSGSQSQLVPELFDEHHAGGYSQLENVHGAGTTGKRAGSREWPGDASVYFSIVPSERVDGLVNALRGRAEQLEPGERLHTAVIPTDNFF
jgi:hypothetical protein